MSEAETDDIVDEFLDAEGADTLGEHADDPMDQVIGYKLRRAQLFVFHDFQKTFQEFGLRPAQYSVLVVLDAHPGQKHTTVADALGINRANLVSLITSLEELGLVERQVLKSDRRSQALFLTERGKSYVQEIRRIQAVHENRMVEMLGGERQKRILLKLLDRLREA